MTIVKVDAAADAGGGAAGSAGDAAAAGADVAGLAGSACGAGACGGCDGCACSDATRLAATTAASMAARIDIIESGERHGAGNGGDCFNFASSAGLKPIAADSISACMMWRLKVSSASVRKVLTLSSLVVARNPSIVFTILV